jgi:hypothetical protein
MSRNALKIIILIALGTVISAPTAGAQDFTMVCEDSLLQGTIGDTLDLMATVTNLTQSLLVLTMTIDTTGFGDWYFQPCFGQGCYLPYTLEMEAYLDSAAVDYVDIKVIPEANPDPATMLVTLDSAFNPGNPQSVLFTVYQTPLGVEVETTALTPGDFSLTPAFPNPFNPGTSFSYTSGQAEEITIAVYNPLGQKVRTLFEGAQVPGTHTFNWNGKNDQGLDLPGALYIITVDNGEAVRTIKSLKLK